MPSFDEIVEEINQIFRYKCLRNSDGKNIKLYHKEVILQGTKARGAGYRLRQKFKDDYEIIQLSHPDQNIPESNKPVLLWLEIGDSFLSVPQSLRERVKQRENVYLLVVDVSKQAVREEGFSYLIERVNYFLTESEKDVDRAISKMAAELYLNVDYAIDEEGITFPDGKIVKPYFKTSYLIDYERSRDILEGLICSTIRKFSDDAKVIVSKEIAGVSPEDNIGMYDLAKSVAKKLEMPSEPIIKTTDGKFILSWKDTTKHRKIILLEDVVGDGATKVKLIDAIRKANGIPKACVVVLDRNEGAKEKLRRRGVELYSLTDIEMYKKILQERRVCL